MANSSFEHKTAAKLLGEDGGSSRTLPIACRFVPMDQWLFTHIDTSWKIKEIKHWILTKCDAWGDRDSRSGKQQQHPQPPRFRPASPVTFAPSRKSSCDSLSSKYEAAEDGETNEDVEDEDDWEVFAYNKELRASEVHLPGASTTAVEKLPITRSATRQELSTAYSSMSLSSAFNEGSASASSSGTSQKYILFSFSCGHALEDEASLNWYKLRPFELLELHRVSAIVPLPRRSALAYAEPYFETPVRVCEGISNKQKARKGAGGVATTAGVRGITEDQHAAHSMEWKNRWAVIREGVLNICKTSSSAPTHRFPMASIIAVRGPERVDVPSKNKTRVISIKFRLPNANPGPPEWSPGYSDVNYNTPWQPPEKRKHKHSKSSTWVILELPTLNAHENILRVLHRLAPSQVQSIFLPDVTQPTKTPHPSPISRLTSPSSPSPLGSPASPASIFGGASSPTLNNDHGVGVNIGPKFATGVQYPEWRHALFDRARQAGVGDVGPAMAHFLCGNDNDPAGVQSDLRKQASTIFTAGTSSSFGHSAHNSVSSTGSASTATGTWVGTDDDEAESDEEDDDDMESLMEWEGWARDVARIAEEQRPPAPAPSSRRSYRDPFMTADGESSGTVRSSVYHVSRALSPSSPSSSECSAAESHDDFGSVGMGRTTSTRARALSFVPPHHMSESSSSSSISPRRSRSSTVTSTATITPDASRVAIAAAPISTKTHAVGLSTISRPADGGLSTSVGTSHSRPSLRLSLATNFGTSTSANVISPSSSSGTRSLLSGSSSSSSQTNSTPSTSSSVHSGGGGMGIGNNMKRVVRNVSIRNAITAGTDRFTKSLENALDFVDGRY